MRAVQTIALACALALGALGAVHAQTLVPAGPIWGDDDANQKCPGACGAVRALWTGRWQASKPGAMSYCACGGDVASTSAFSSSASSSSSCSVGENAGCPGCGVTCTDGRQAICRSARITGGGDLPIICVRPAECRCE